MNVIIIHGLPSPNKIEKARDPERRTYDKNWILWTKKQLQAKGVDVQTPLMPEPWYPDYDNWKLEFGKLRIDEDTILIGTSGGGAFLARWLGETKRVIKKLILVAPIKISVEHPHLKEFLDFEIDETIKNRAEEIVIFTSDNDSLVILDSVKIYYEKLGGKLIELKSYGHFMEKHMGTNEFPELLEEILK